VSLLGLAQLLLVATNKQTKVLKIMIFVFAQSVL